MKKPNPLFSIKSEAVIGFVLDYLNNHPDIKYQFYYVKSSFYTSFYYFLIVTKNSKHSDDIVSAFRQATVPRNFPLDFENQLYRDSWGQNYLSDNNHKLISSR